MYFSFQQFTRFATVVLCLNLIVLTALAPVAARPLALRPNRMKELSPQSQPQDLSPGKTVEFKVSSLEPQKHTFVLTANQFIKLKLQSQYKEIIVSVQGPQQEIILPQTSFTPGEFIFPILILAKTDGDYRLEISSSAISEAPARYVLTQVESGVPTDRELYQLAAFQLLKEANQFKNQQTKASTLKAIEKAQAAVDQYRLAEDSRSAAQVINIVGNDYYQLGDLTLAREYYEKSLELGRKLNDPKVIGQAMTNAGLTYHVQGNIVKAAELYQEALSLRQKCGDLQGEGETLANIGGIYQIQNQWYKALDYFNQSLTRFQQTGFQEGEAAMLNQMGGVYSRLGDLQKAADTYSRGLSIRRAQKQQLNIAQSLCSLASIAAHQGEFQKALDLYEESLQLIQDTGHAYLHALAFAGVGRLYLQIRDYQQAETALRQALEVVRKIGNRNWESALLVEIGTTYLGRDQFTEALDHFTQALAISRELKNILDEGTVLHHIAFTCYKLGKQDEALKYYEASLVLCRQAKDLMDELSTLFNMASIYIARNEDQIANQYIQDILKRWPEGMQPANRALVLNLQACLRIKAKDYLQAKTLLEEAIQLIEGVRGKVRNPELRTTFFAQSQNVYERYIELLAFQHTQDRQAGYDALALQMSEHTRARVLLDLLNESGVDFRQGGNPELIERERTTRQRLVAKIDGFNRLQARSALTKETEAEFRAEIEAISKEYEQIEDTLRRTSPRYTALSEPKPLTVNEIQSRIVAPDTVLLEYFLGESRSFVWVVTPDSLTTVQLPKKADIERLARQAYDLMAETGDTNRTIRLDSIKSEQTQAALNEALSKLSHIILGPVASHLGNKRLLIVPDGVLHFIPFAALPVENAQSKPEPLLTSHELVVLPSASALDVLRTETLDRPKPTKELAVVADPVFDPTDGRLPKPVTRLATAAPTNQKLDRKRQLRLEKTKSSIQEVGIADEAHQIPRLPGTRREAESILKFVPKTKAAHAFDFTASRSFFDRPDLDQFRLLHIATHGFINSERPEFSGLIFSMFDQQGNAQNGFLLLPDVFNLKLNTDLVTLSACQSGLGKEIKGEGLVGLTQGFLYAGTSRVLVSLWNVSDQATAELMKHFYQGLLVEKLRPADALRRAQLNLRQHKKWSSPYYWAAFQLTGEWK